MKRYRVVGQDGGTLTAKWVNPDCVRMTIDGDRDVDLDAAQAHQLGNYLAPGDGARR